MRLLTNSEIQEVNGGVGVGGALIGAVIGGGSQYVNGACTPVILGATVLGAASGFAGNMAGSLAAGGVVVRAAWRLRQVGHGVASGALGLSDCKNPDLETESS